MPKYEDKINLCNSKGECTAIGLNGMMCKGRHKGNSWFCMYLYANVWPPACMEKDLVKEAKNAKQKK